MKLTNPTVIDALSKLMEHSGVHAGVTYLGAARDKDGRQFLVCESNYPVGFTVDVDGDIVLNSDRLKGATKFQHAYDTPVKEAFSTYCEKVGLVDSICFQLNTLEKAMTIAMLNNVSQQVLRNRIDPENTELVGKVAEETLNQLKETVIEAIPEMFSDEDSLVQAMIAAGMQPVRSTDAGARIPFTNMENLAKVGTVQPLPENEDLERSEQLIKVMREVGNLNESESEMLEHLEHIVGEKRMRQQVLEQVKNDRSNVVAMVRGALLKGPMSNLGLWRKYVA